MDVPALDLGPQMSNWFEDYVLPALLGAMLLGFALICLGLGLAIFRLGVGI